MTAKRFSKAQNKLSYYFNRSACMLFAFVLLSISWSSLAVRRDCYTVNTTFWNTVKEEYTTLVDATVCDKLCLSRCICIFGENSFSSNCSEQVSENIGVKFPTEVTTLYLGNHSINVLREDAFSNFAATLLRLYLNDNKLFRLRSDVFKRLTNLKHLVIYNNELNHIPAGVFIDLVSLQELNLDLNKLTVLRSDAFIGLGTLTVLEIELNELSYIGPGTFVEVPNLQILNLQTNLIPELDKYAFNRLDRLQELDLDRNRIKTISVGVFNGLISLKSLDLDHNFIQYIPLHVFQDLGNLTELDMDNNLLHTLHSDVFRGLKSLKELELDNNDLASLLSGAFNHVDNLERLSLSYNLLAEIEPTTFQRLTNLKELHLGHNYISEVQAIVFNNIQKIETLYLNNNDIEELDYTVFDGLKQLQVLSIAQNRLRNLPFDIFKNIHNLRHLNLSGNTLQTINAGTFEPTRALITLDLTQNPLLWLIKEGFNNIKATTIVFVDAISTCCYLPVANCFYQLPPSPFISCKRLLPYSFLRVIVWFLCMFTILGNSFVLLSRYLSRKSPNAQALLISNLSLSDLFMGIYMACLICADLYYTEFFPSHSEFWRQSILCRVAGALSVLSCEASVFFITAISFDRFIAILYPFSSIHFRQKYRKVLIVSLWLIAIVICVASIVLPTVNPKLYSVSEICVGLPISRSNYYTTEIKHINLNTSLFKTGSNVGTALETTLLESKSSMYFSIALFAGLNLACFLVVAVCYISIFITVKQTSSEAGRRRVIDDDIKLAIKMAGIVFSDFCCWMVVVILTILVQAGVVTIDPVAYAWIATFILPINSCLNPFLYTFVTFISDLCRKKERVVTNVDLDKQTSSASFNHNI